MIGMMLVTHGRLAEEFVDAMEHVVGPQAAGRHRSASARRRHGSPAQGNRQGDQAASIRARASIILTDLFGGTPSNLAISLLKAGKTRSDRRHQPADADPPRRRAQGHGPRRRGRRPRATPAATTSPSPPSSSGRRLNGADAQRPARRVTIVNKRGLHARASAKFVTLAAGIRCADRGREGRRAGRAAPRSWG